jgi:hypothetical protein
MASDIGTVMDQIGTALATITGLRVYDFPPKSAQPPFAFVDMPDQVEFDLAYGRGADRTTINVVVGVADVIDRASRDALAGYAAGSGASSIKAVLDAASIGSSRRVESVKFQPVTLAGGTYVGAVFALDIVF